jgi:hypothetical protein
VKRTRSAAWRTPPILIALLALAVLGSGQDDARAQADDTPPVLVEFAIDPATVDVTGEPADVTFTARITDTPAA